MNKILFSSGTELGNLVVNLEPVHLAWDSIVDLYREVNSNDQRLPIKFKATQLPYLTVLTFATASSSTSNQELVSPKVLEDTFRLFEFLCSPSNPSFPIDKAVIKLFASAFNELSQLKDQYVNSRPLVITGHALGGSIATLFALWLLQSSELSTTNTICITFGSPLIGDNNFQKAISECPAWHSSFLHVVSNKEAVFSNKEAVFSNKEADVSNKEADVSKSQYEPFGSFMFCSESGCACFDDSEFISLLLASMKDSLKYQPLQPVDYGSILKNLKPKVLMKASSDVDQQIANALVDGIGIQLQTIGIGGAQNSAKDMARRRQEKIAVSLLPRKLDDVKIDMARLEWYKKKTKKEGIGYYDSYKRGLPMDIDVVFWKTRLTLYWEKMVDEVEKKPQKKGAKFRTRWIFAGTNYRRMVEPLDIAVFYGKKNSQGSYLESRAKHYKLLEEWQKDEEEKKDRKYDRKEPIGMTDDSCFWAYVEEAIKSCGLLNIGNLSNEQRQVTTQSLHDFEEYLMGLIEKFAVSSEVFLQNSSLMMWWGEYENIIGTHNSAFIDFMRRRKYRQYV